MIGITPKNKMFDLGGLDEGHTEERGGMFGEECDDLGIDESDDEFDIDFEADAEEVYTITKLTPGMKDKNRVNVFLDGNFAFSLDLAQVVEFDVKVGQSVDAERLKSLKNASEFGKLYQRTLEWVLTRPHSVREVQDYFRRRKLKRCQLNRQRVREGKKELPPIQDEHVEMVTERLIAKGYINDQKFALFYIENRRVRRGISQKRLRLELKRKGVSDEIIHEALAKQPRDEQEEIQKMITKKRRKYNDYQLVGYLVRQGFDYQMAKTAVERYTEDAEESAEN